MKTLTAEELEDYEVDGPRDVGITEEIGGYHDEKAGLLGILIRDKVDDDFGYVVLKQKKGNWAAIDVNSSFEKKSDAEVALLASFKKNGSNG
jgi:hypothetical protein